MTGVMMFGMVATAAPAISAYAEGEAGGKCRLDGFDRIQGILIICTIYFQSIHAKTFCTQCLQVDCDLVVLGCICTYMECYFER